MRHKDGTNTTRRFGSPVTETSTSNRCEIRSILIHFDISNVSGNLFGRIIMSAIEPMIRQLRKARGARKLSQRALGAKAGLPQGHISRIEAGEVDLKLSSLLGLARALDLEPMLVPRRRIKAVDAIIRSPGRVGDHLAAGASAHLTDLAHAIRQRAGDRPGPAYRLHDDGDDEDEEAGGGA